MERDIQGKNCLDISCEQHQTLKSNGASEDTLNRRAIVTDYLISRAFKEGNLLHEACKSETIQVVKYLIEERQMDPKESNSQG